MTDRLHRAARRVGQALNPGARGLYGLVNRPGVVTYDQATVVSVSAPSGAGLAARAAVSLIQPDGSTVTTPPIPCHAACFAGDVVLVGRRGGQAWVDRRLGNDHSRYGVAAQALYNNGWGDIGGGWAPVTYWRDADGVVHLQGLMSGGTVGLRAFLLPVGFRPSAGNLTFGVGIGSGLATFGMLQVNSGGSVTPQTAGSNVGTSVSGVSWSV